MRVKSICPTTLLKQGISLGVRASTVASALFWAVFVVSGGIYAENNTQEPIDPYLLVVILAIATMVVMLFPGAIGGAANACILYRLTSRKKLTRITGVSSGLLIGLVAGFSTAVATMLITGGSLELDAADVKYCSMMICIATFSGGWHGWALGRRMIRADSCRSQTSR